MINSIIHQSFFSLFIRGLTICHLPLQPSKLNLCIVFLLQGYPRELLPVTCVGIPSMHICLDFIAELLSQPDFQKQIFAIDLISNISQQYPLPKSLSLARLAINTMYTFLSGKMILLFFNNNDNY